MVVHGREGLCDLSIAGPSVVGRWDGRRVTVEEVTCDVVGAGSAPLDGVLVDGPQASARLIEAVLGGAPGAAREMVVFNAAAALWVAGLADGWAEGAAMARRAIDLGKAMKTLERWRAIAAAPPK